MTNRELAELLRQIKVETGSLMCLDCGYEHNCGVHGCNIMHMAADALGNSSRHVEALQKEIERLRRQNQQLRVSAELITKEIAENGKTWMCQYCAHCKGIVSGIADCDAREPCVMPYSKFELKLEGDEYEEKYTEQEWISVLQDRLAAYEDTGLMPEDCAEYKKFEDEVIASGKTFGRLIELLNADRAGRLVVLPCKVGNTVYWLHNGIITECRAYRAQANRNGTYICLRSNVSHGAFRVDLTWGETVFLTREEAEKALEAKRDGD